MADWNLAGPLHARLSQTRAQAQYQDAKAARSSTKTRGQAFRAAFHQDMRGGICAVRKVGTPLTVGVDALCGTERTGRAEQAGRKKTLADLKKHPCDAGAVGAVGVAAIAGTAVLVSGAGGITGATLGYVSSIFTRVKLGTSMTQGAKIGALATMPVVKGIGLVGGGLIQGAALLATGPKLLLGGVGAVGGGAYGIVHGAAAAAKHKVN